jgi:hypothetical protein
MRRSLLLGLCVVAIGVLSYRPALCSVGVGPRLGATIDPDQVHFGGHVALGEFYPGWVFQPNVEVGVGDDLKVVALNLETVYRFSEMVGEMGLYGGLGVGVNFIDFDKDVEFLDHRGGFDDDDTEVGLNLLLGLEKTIQNRDSFFGEIKVGLADSPDFKLTFGWTFYAPWSR